MLPSYLKLLLISVLVAVSIETANSATGLRFTRDQADKVTIPDSRSLDINGTSITMEAWIRCPNPNLNSEMTFINKENSYEMKVGNGAVWVAIMSANWAWLGANNAINANQWYHVAATYDGQNVKLYINGEQRYSGAKNGDIRPSDSLLFFGTRPLQAFIHNYLGDLDEIRIWNITRTEAQLRANMNIALSGREEGLVGYWRMDEGEGQVVRDLTGNANHGVLGTNGNVENSDPVYFESDAPIRGGVLDLSLQEINFIPTPVGRLTSIPLMLSNVSEEEGDLFNVDFSFQIVGNNADWLAIDPTEGTIQPEEVVEVDFAIDTDDLQEGVYRASVRLTANAINLLDMILPVSVTVTPGAGSISGTVVDARNDRPIEGALISFVGDFHLETMSDENGRFEFNDLGSTNYRLQILAEDFLPFLSGDIELEPNDNLDLDFALLHSEFDPNPAVVDFGLQPDDTLRVPVAIRNPGNGPLTWSAALDFPDELELDPWSNRQNLAISEIVGDDRLQGITFADDHFFISGAADQRKLVYIVDREGELIDTFRQLSPSRYGFASLAWDGENLWGAGDQQIFSFTTRGDSLTSFAGPFNPSSNIAWDSRNGLLWLAGTTTNISSVDREGRVIATLNRRGMRIYGLGYYPEDRDGFYLYVLTNPDGNRQVVMKMNPENGDTMRVRELPDSGGRPAGSAITNLYDPYSWVMLAVDNIGANDEVNVWHLSANTSWVSFSPNNGVVDAGNSEELTIRFDTRGLSEGLEYTATLLFSHDGVGGSGEIPVSLTVTGEGGLSNRVINLETGWNLVSVNLIPEELEGGFAGTVAPLVEEGRLLLAKNGAGDFFVPGQFNGIDLWNFGEGYWLKVNGPSALRIGGIGVGAGEPLPVESGWNLVSYLPRRAMEAPEAFAGLEGNLVIARDGFGRFYLPSYGFDDLGGLREGKGYQIKVLEDAELVWGQGDQIARIVAKPYSQKDLAWLEELRPTGVMMNLLVKTDLAEGTRLTARGANGDVFGRGVVREGGLAGVTLWGDDATTAEIDGFETGETFRVAVANGDELSLKIVEGSATFDASGWAVGEAVSASLQPADFGLTAVWPNPFNGQLRVTFGVAKSGTVDLRAYDISGREVAQLFAGTSVGSQELVWDAVSLPGGIYFLKLTADGRTDVAKVLLMK